jgi:predicted MPP superfamily phosphohydrolase
MKLLLVHLSDIHIKGDADPVLARANLIADAVQNLDYALDAAVIVVSGDLAFAGSTKQYDVAWQFLNSLSSRLSIQLSNASGERPLPLKILAIPGNHDSDLSEPEGARMMVLEGILRNPAQVKDASVVAICTAVQDNFFEYFESYGQYGELSPASDYHKRLAYECSVAIGDEIVRFLCFNTALLSQRLEKQGSLYFPPEAVPTVRADDDLVVVMFHHPYNWIEANAARAFRKRVEEVADLILTGHEHDATLRTQQARTGEVNTYVEGGALQDSYDPAASTFNAFVLDLAAHRQKFARFVWNGTRYVLAGQTREDNDGAGLTWEEYQVNRLRARGQFELAESMHQRLDDAGVSLVHHDRGTLRLSDIFVFPDLQEVVYPRKHSGRIIHGEGIIDLLTDTRHVLLIGDTQSGKTCLGKILYRSFYQGGYVPLMLDGSQSFPKGDRLFGLLEKSYTQQYEPATLDAYRQLDRSRRVVILDDFHKFGGGPQRRREFIESLAAFAGRVILLANDLVLEATELLQRGEPTIGSVVFTLYRIQPFGHLRRSELVEKWLLLSRDIDTSGVEFAHSVDSITRTLDTLIGRNFIPAYPVYVLAVLQGFEARTPIDTRASTHGYFYELFIRTALARGHSQESFDVMMSYLAYFAYQLFFDRTRRVDNDAFERIHADFEARYEITRSSRQIRADLTQRDIFEVSEDLTRFKYNYVYYYFVASYMRDHVNTSEVRTKIAELSRSLYIEEHSNILLFLAHLSKDPIILQEMLAAAAEFYPDVSPIAFDKDVLFFKESEMSRTQLTYKERDPAETRKERLALLDQQENEVTSDDDSMLEVEPAPDVIDPIARFNGALKTIQILGQILKNFPGSLEGVAKFEITQACYHLGLRALTSIFDPIRANKDFLLELAEAIREQYPRLTDAEAYDRAWVTVVQLAQWLAYGMVKYISGAVGSNELLNTYKRVLQENKFPSIQLINISLSLDNTGAFPVGAISNLARTLETYPFALSVLRYLVLDHFYLFPVKMGVKQKVCAVLNIPYTHIYGADPNRRLLTD